MKIGIRGERGDGDEVGDGAHLMAAEGDGRCAQSEVTLLPYS